MLDKNNKKPAENEDIVNVFDPAYIARELMNSISSNLNPAEVLKQLGGIDEKAFNIAKTFGVGKESVLGLKNAMAAARDGVVLLGGDMDTIVKTQQDVASALGRNVVISADAQKELYAAFKVSGVEIGSMVKAFKDVGISALDAGKKMADVVNAARQAGVSAKAVSTLVVDNMSKMNLYNFKDGVEGLSRMAAQATAMKIDMSSMFTIAEKAFNPESAIKMAASLQRLGVTQSELLDPLSLMNMAENDPEELQNQILKMSQQFVQLNKDGQFEILPGAKRQMREIEKSLDMAPGSLSKMAIASAEAEEKMKRIKFPEFVNEEQKKYLANIAEMKDGKMMIEVNGESMELDKAIAKAGNQEGIKELLKATEKKDIVELAEDQLSVLDDINIGINYPKGKTAVAASTTKTGEKFVRGIGKTTKEMGVKAGDVLGTTKEMSQWMKTNIDPLGEKLSKLDFTNLQDLDTAANLLSKEFEKLIKSTETQNKLNEAKDLLKNIPGADKVFNIDYVEFGKTIVNALKEWTKIGNDVLITPEGAIKFNPEDTILAGTGLDVISKMLENPKKKEEALLPQEKTTTEFKNKNEVTNPTQDILKILETIIPKTEVPQLPTNIMEMMAKTKVAEPIINKQNETREIKIDLTVNVTAPPQIDTNQIANVLKDQLVIQQLIQKIEQVSTNNNLTRVS